MSESLRRAVADYIYELEHQGPIVSTSRVKLSTMWKLYGQEATDAEIQRQLDELDEESTDGC
jgi:hypothetical protein